MTTLTTAHRIVLVAAGVALAACGGDTPTNDAEVQTSGPNTAPAADSSSAPTEPFDDEPPDHTLLPSAGSSDVIVIAPGGLDPAGTITGEAPQSIVDDLIERVSSETGVDPGEVIVISAFAKTWTEGSLGCAEPGIVYTHREQSGYQVKLVAADTSWDFRVRENGDAIVCTDGLVLERTVRVSP